MVENKIWKRDELPDIHVYLPDGKLITISDEIGLPIHVVDFIARKLVEIHKNIRLKSSLDHIFIADSKNELGKKLRTECCYLKEHNVIAVVVDLPSDDSVIVSDDGYEHIDWEEKLILILGHELYHFIRNNQIDLPDEGFSGKSDEEEAKAYEYSVDVLKEYREFIGRDKNWFEEIVRLLIESLPES